MSAMSACDQPAALRFRANCMCNLSSHALPSLPSMYPRNSTLLFNIAKQICVLHRNGINYLRSRLLIWRYYSHYMDYFSAVIQSTKISSEILESSSIRKVVIGKVIQFKLAFMSYA